MKKHGNDASPTQNFLTDPDTLEDGLRMGGAGVWRWKIDSNQLEWSRNLEGVHQLPPGSFDGTLSSFQRDLHPADAGRVWQAIARALRPESPTRRSTELLRAQTNRSYGSRPLAGWLARLMAADI